MSCNCMTRTSQQECRGILELKCHRQREWKYILTSNCRNVEQLRSKKGSTFKMCCKVTLFPVRFLPVDGQRQSGKRLEKEASAPGAFYVTVHIWGSSCTKGNGLQIVCGLDKYLVKGNRTEITGVCLFSLGGASCR